MYCKFCGQEIDDNSAFCKFCGEAVASPACGSQQIPASSEELKPPFSAVTSKDPECLVEMVSEEGFTKPENGAGPNANTSQVCYENGDPSDKSNQSSSQNQGGNPGYFSDVSRPFDRSYNNPPPYQESSGGCKNSGFSPVPSYSAYAKENPADKPIYKILLIIICIFQGLMVIGIFLFYLLLLLGFLFDTSENTAVSTRSYEQKEEAASEPYFDYDDFYDEYENSSPYFYFDEGDDSFYYGPGTDRNDDSIYFFGEDDGSNDYDGEEEPFDYGISDDDTIYFYGEDDSDYDDGSDYYDFFKVIPYHKSTAPSQKTI